MQTNQTNPSILAQQFSSPDLRAQLRKSLAGFCLIYLHRAFYLPPAMFHRELISELENPDIQLLEVMGFRGSAKSTLGSFALPLWAALEKPELYPFVMLIADTGQQTSLNVANIKNELDTNLLIKQDYGNVSGDFIEDWSLESEEEWQSKNMLLSNGVRILARSRGQKVRGLRHREHRPKLVIVDDPEDLEWVRTKENRDKTDRWFSGEVVPAMDARNRKLVLNGALVCMPKPKSAEPQQEEPDEKSIKVGRTLSEHTKAAINKAIDASKACTAALEELLTAAEPQGDEGKEQARDGAAPKSRSKEIAESLFAGFDGWQKKREVLRFFVTEGSKVLAEMNVEAQDRARRN